MLKELKKYNDLSSTAKNNNEFEQDINFFTQLYGLIRIVRMNILVKRILLINQRKRNSLLIVKMFYQRIKKKIKNNKTRRKNLKIKIYSVLVVKFAFKNYFNNITKEIGFEQKTLSRFILFLILFYFYYITRLFELLKFFISLIVKILF